jgi:hypothetical protein
MEKAYLNISMEADMVYAMSQSWGMAETIY